jgi:hypothetical protein
MQNLLESQNLDGLFPLHFCSETTLDEFFCSPSPDKKAMSHNRSTKYSSSYCADSQDHCRSHDEGQVKAEFVARVLIKVINCSG